MSTMLLTKTRGAPVRRNAQLRLALRKHPFSRGLSRDHIELLVEHGETTEFESGRHLWRQGDLARETYLVLDGKIALEIAVPNQDRISFDLIVAGEVAGCSALVASTRWGFDARSVGEVRAITLDARALRRYCESDHEFGYRLLQKCAHTLGHRLDVSRAKLIEAHDASLP